MVVEEVCIVRRNLASQCLNQDVLFLGTGKQNVAVINMHL